MAFNIPRSNIYKAQPIDFSSIDKLISDVHAKRESNYQKQRLAEANIQDKIKDLNSTANEMSEHQKKALVEIDNLQQDYAKKLTYDNEGKLKRFLGAPTLTPEEESELTFKAAELAKKFSTWNANDKFMTDAANRYNATPEKFNPDKWRIAQSDYKATGGDKITTNPLIPASANPYLEFSKLDIRNKAELQPIIDPVTGTKTYPELNPSLRDNLYYSSFNNNVPLQNGVVDLMMKDVSMSTEEKVAYMIGTMLSPEDLTPTETMESIGGAIDPNTEGTLQRNAELQRMQRERVIGMTEAKVRDMVVNYEKYREYDPYLINAAKYYGADVLKLNERIGKGSVREDPQAALRMQAARERLTKDKEEKLVVKPQERSIDFMGLKLNNYVDVSTVPEATRRLPDYRLSKGSIKAEVKDGDKVAKKNPPETKQDIDYTVSGWDQNAGWIRLKRRYEDEDNRPKEEEYLIPYKGNEYIVNDIKKTAFGKESIEKKDYSMDDIRKIIEEGI